MRRDFALGLRYLVVLTLPASVLFAVLAQPMLGVLTIGKFSVHSAQVTGDTLQLFAISLVGFSVYLYTLRAFYALADTRTPFLLNLGENALNIVLAIALWGPLGIQGLALAWSISYFVAAAASLVVLHRRIGRGIGAGIARRDRARRRSGRSCSRSVAVALAAAIGDEHGPPGARRHGRGGRGRRRSAYLLVLAVTRSEELARDRGDGAPARQRGRRRVTMRRAGRSKPDQSAPNGAEGGTMPVRIVTDSACDFPTPCAKSSASRWSRSRSASASASTSTARS